MPIGPSSGPIGISSALSRPGNFLGRALVAIGFDGGVKCLLEQQPAEVVGGPISGASMNPIRSLGPGIIAGNLHDIWIYLLAPVAGTALGGLAYQFVRGE